MKIGFNRIATNYFIPMGQTVGGTCVLIGWKGGGACFTKVLLALFWKSSKEERNVALEMRLALWRNIRRLSE
jgi:hypothetical protein